MLTSSMRLILGLILVSFATTSWAAADDDGDGLYAHPGFSADVVGAGLGASESTEPRNDKLNCRCDSKAVQTASFHDIALHIDRSNGISSSDWPASMRDGTASYYAGAESYVRKNKYCAATPIRKGIKKGICLLVTSKKDPSRHVAVVTADVGGFNNPGRVLDLCKASAEKIDPKYKKTGKMEITAVEVPMSVCKDQS